MNQPKRSRVKVSLRGLLLFVAINSIIVGWWHQNINRPQIAIQYLLDHADLNDISFKPIHFSNSSRFYKWLASAFGLEYDPESVTAIKRASLTKLDILRFFPNLEEFQNVAYVDRSQLYSFRSLYKIKSLQLETNAKDLNFLAHLKDLKSLTVRSHELDNISAILGCKAIEYLDFSGCPLSDPLTTVDLPNLRELYLAETKVANLTWLTHCTAIEYLWLPNSEIDWLAGIETCTNLVELNVSNTHVEDLNPIRNLHRIKSLNLEETNVSNLEPLSGLGQIKSLDLSETPITTDQLHWIPNLVDLDAIEENERRGREVQRRIEEEKKKNVYYIPNIGGSIFRGESTYLDLSGTPIENIEGLRGQKTLTQLNLANTQIVDVTPLISKDLGILDLSNTLVANLPSRHSFKPTSIDLSNSKFASLTTYLDADNSKDDEYFELDRFDLRGAPFTSFGQLDEVANSLLEVSVEGLTNSQISDLDGVRSLQLIAPKISSVESLVELKYLNSIEIHDHPQFKITNAINELLELREVVFVRTKIQASGLSTRSVPAIVEFRECQIDDLGWLDNSDIESLVLKDCNFASGFKWPNMPNLTQLAISNCRSIQVNEISKYKELRELSLEYCDVRDLNFLAPLAQLRVLNLGHSHTMGLSQLQNLNSLRFLNLTGKKLSVDEFSELRGLIPHCDIYFNEVDFSSNAFSWGF